MTVNCEMIVSMNKNVYATLTTAGPLFVSETLGRDNVEVRIYEAYCAFSIGPLDFCSICCCVCSLQIKIIICVYMKKLYMCMYALTVPSRICNPCTVWRGIECYL